MSFWTPAKTTKARKQHKCTYCCEQILVGESYQRWNSVDESWFSNKMHNECFEYFAESGDNEYHAFTGERPPKETA